MMSPGLEGSLCMLGDAVWCTGLICWPFFRKSNSYIHNKKKNSYVKEMHCIKEISELSHSEQ